MIRVTSVGGDSPVIFSQGCTRSLIKDTGPEASVIGRLNGGESVE